MKLVRSRVAAALLGVSVLLPLAALADWEAGHEFVSAVDVDITPDGLDAITGILPTLIPERIDLPEIHQSGSSWCFGYWFDVWNMWVGIDLQEAHIIPGNGTLTFDATATVNVNDEFNQIGIDAGVDYCFSDLSVSCPMYVEPATIYLSAPISLAIVDDQVNPPYLDATVGTIEWDITNLDLAGDCILGDLFEILNDIGIDLEGLILDLARPVLDDQIQSFGPTIEATLEDAFGAASIQQQVALGESTLDIDVHPDNIVIVPEGVRVSMGGSFASTTNPCVVEYGHYESRETAGDAPEIGWAPPQISFSPHHIGAMIDDDFANSALFAAYNGGLLCYTLSGGEGSDLPLDTNLLSLIDGEDFGPLFPENKPITIQTRPAEVPYAEALGDHDLNVKVEKLGVDFMADLDGRYANVLGVDLDVDAGVDLNFDENTGNLALGLDLEGDAIQASMRLNEFAPGKDEQIAEQFGTIFDAVAGPLLGGITEGLGFALPSFSGFGVTQAEIEASGPNRDWVGLYANVGTVTYAASEGCGADAGCGGGCGTSGTIPVRPVMMLIPLALAAIRRRRR